jgi:peptidoglycan/LPS O-acetylase OafA/YrhL
VTIVRTYRYYQSPVTTAIVQIASIALAALALIMGAYLLIIGKRPWRGGGDSKVAPRVRLLGVSYILVFGAAMIQIITQPHGDAAALLGGLMVIGGVIVILVVYLEARASKRAGREDLLDSRLRD